LYKWKASGGEKGLKGKKRRPIHDKRLCALSDPLLTDLVRDLGIGEKRQNVGQGKKPKRRENGEWGQKSTNSQLLSRFKAMDASVTNNEPKREGMRRKKEHW